MTKHIVAAGRLQPYRQMYYALDAILPEVGDKVRFRYTPNLLTITDVKDTPHDGLVAVVQGPTGGFACRLDDLRVIEKAEEVR